MLKLQQITVDSHIRTDMNGSFAVHVDVEGLRALQAEVVRAAVTEAVVELLEMAAVGSGQTVKVIEQAPH